MDARRPRRLERMRNYPNRQPSGDAIRHGAERPAVLDALSAPVFRFGLRDLARGRDSLEFGLYQVAQGSVFLFGQRLKPCFQFGVDQDVQVHFCHVATPYIPCYDCSMITQKAYKFRIEP